MKEKKNNKYTVYNVLIDLKQILVKALNSDKCSPNIIKIIGTSIDKIRMYIILQQ